ncbi:unnamed protein product [Gongylonema pulchrum]|uniref:Metal-binding protein n=1 Tax=Gongylonema pulchrum TaxID=637853 RepID=A0A183DSI5_9BILA|nr:unnamed protein product [Gongylonema pulchrum]
MIIPGHAARVCKQHPKRIHLMDVKTCPNRQCRSEMLNEIGDPIP